MKMVLPPTPLVLVCSNILFCHTCCRQVSSSYAGKTQQSTACMLTLLLLSPRSSFRGAGKNLEEPLLEVEWLVMLVLEGALVLSL